MELILDLSNEIYRHTSLHIKLLLFGELVVKNIRNEYLRKLLFYACGIALLLHIGGPYVAAVCLVSMVMTFYLMITYRKYGRIIGFVSGISAILLFTPPLSEFIPVLITSLVNSNNVLSFMMRATRCYVSVGYELQKKKKNGIHKDKDSNNCADHEEPNLSDFIAYVLFYPSVLGCIMVEYKDFVRCAIKCGDFVTQPRHVYADSRPSILKERLLVFVYEVKFMLFSVLAIMTNIFINYFGLAYKHGETANGSSMLGILIIVYFTGLLYRSRAYFYMFGSDALLLSSGRFYDVIRASEENQGDPHHINSYKSGIYVPHLYNWNPFNSSHIVSCIWWQCDLSAIETTFTKNQFSRWNRTTNTWLRKHVFKPIRTSTGSTVLAVVITYLTSAIWHGLNPGFYIFYLVIYAMTSTLPRLVTLIDSYETATANRSSGRLLVFIVRTMNMSISVIQMAAGVSCFECKRLDICIEMLGSIYYIPFTITSATILLSKYMEYKLNRIPKEC